MATVVPHEGSLVESQCHEEGVEFPGHAGGEGELKRSISGTSDGWGDLGFGSAASHPLRAVAGRIVVLSVLLLVEALLFTLLLDEGDETTLHLVIGAVVVVTLWLIAFLLCLEAVQRRIHSGAIARVFVVILALFHSIFLRMLLTNAAALGSMETLMILSAAVFLLGASVLLLP
jgi:hypothetical protein